MCRTLLHPNNCYTINFITISNCHKINFKTSNSTYIGSSTANSENLTFMTSAYILLTQVRTESVMHVMEKESYLNFGYILYLAQWHWYWHCIFIFHLMSGSTTIIYVLFLTWQVFFQTEAYTHVYSERAMIFIH